METLQEYFERRDTPAAGSPVGALMVKVLAKNPGMSFEAARSQAHELQQRAAGSKAYRFPRVLSPEEQALQREHLRARFSALPMAA